MSVVKMTESRNRAEAKDCVREQMKRARSQKDSDWIREKGEEVQRRALGMETFVNATRVGCYCSIASEVGTDIVISACREMKKRLFLPAFDVREKVYQFGEVETGTVLIPGPLGILEPSGGVSCDAAELDMIIVPGLAFDESGNRLGHGAGHYDALLRDAGSAYKAGFAFEFQMVESLIPHERDVAMNAVITNTRVMRVMNENKRKMK
jgi:5-formyltetrahydrofolate cyclo-ligase